MCSTSRTSNEMPFQSSVHEAGKVHGSAAGSEGSEMICCVCLAPTEQQTPCGHLLCAECHFELRKNTCPVCRAALPLEGAGPHCQEQEENTEDLEDLPEMVRQNGISLRSELRNEAAFRSRLHAVLEEPTATESCSDRPTRRSGTFQTLGNAMHRSLRRLSF